MLGRSRRMRSPFAVAVIVASVWLPIAAPAQDLVPISSLTGGSSVFVVRNAARGIRKSTAEAKPNRTKQQRLETVAKLNKQYDATAKLHREVSKVVKPAELPKNYKVLPPAEGSKLLAGVGEYYLAKNDLEKASEFFSDAATLNDKNKAATQGLSDVFAIQGNQLLAADKASSAKGYFLEALKWNPNNSGALFGLGEVYSELDQTKEAIDAYEKSLAGNKDLTVIYGPLGILYYQNGDIAKADAMLAKAIAASDTSPETQLFVGLVRLAQNANDKALAAFQKADQTQAETQYYTGQALVRMKRTEDAVPYFRRATEIRPQYFDAWFSLGEAEYELGHWEPAVTAYRAALKLKNTDWEVYAGLADSLRQSGHYEEAAGFYSNAANFYTRDPEHNVRTLADLYSKRGLSLGQQCDLNMQRYIECAWPSTITALQRAAELSNDPVDQVNLGWAYFRAGHTDVGLRNMAAATPNLQTARDILVKAAAVGGQTADFANQNLAAVQIDLGDYKAAIETLGKLVKSKPDLAFGKYALGVAYYKSGDAGNAEKWLRDAVQAEPTNVAYLMGLGDVLINRRNGKDARKIADQIRSIDPQSAAQLDQKIKMMRL